jgi:glutamate--cysteine ligase
VKESFMEDLLVTEDTCSRIWLEPIKTQSHGVPKIGLEMEFFAYEKHNDILYPLGTGPMGLTPSILFERVAAQTPGAKVIRDKISPITIGVQFENGGNLSSEPGGQVEFSSSPRENLTTLNAEALWALGRIEEAAAGELLFLSHGTNPITAPDHPLVMPKERYQIMSRYYASAPPEVRGTHMMRHSGTVQANMDVFGQEQWQDAVNLTLVLIPLTMGLFANSNYFQGKRSKFPSERQDIWKHMEPSRSGMPTGLLFAENTECQYARWGKEANVFLVEGLPIEEQPLYGELTFSQWLNEGYRGRFPRVKDWQNHLTTLFPHLRLRSFLEVRHIDAQPFEHTLAPVAFFYACLNTQHCRSQVWSYLREQKIDFQSVIHEDGMSAHFAKYHRPLLDLAVQLSEHLNEPQGVRTLKAYGAFLEAKAQAHFPISTHNDVGGGVDGDTAAFDFVHKYARKDIVRGFSGLSVGQI